MEMHQIRYFLALAEELNFTRASQRCHVSQPSLTRAINKLEDELGGEIVQRRQGQTQLTALGFGVLPHLREIAARVQAVKVDAQLILNTAKTRLRLGVACEVTTTCLSNFLAAFGQKHPEVILEVSILQVKRLEAMLISGDLDVAISARPGASDRQLEFRTLYREPVVIVLHPLDPLVARDAVRLAETRGKRYLARANCEFDSDHAEGTFGVMLDTACRSERDEWLVAMVSIGLGFALLPESRSSHPEVVVRPIAEPKLELSIGLITAPGRTRPAGLKPFVHELETYFQTENSLCKKVLV